MDQNTRSDAALAEENERLRAELRESLEYQEATGDVLRVIAESTTDVEPVMTVIAEYAARLCAARDVRLYRVSDGVLRATGALGSIGSLGPDEMPIDSGSLAGRAAIEKRLIHVDDVAAVQDEFVHTKSILARAKFGSVLGVPMMREDCVVGVIIVLREEVAPFSRKQRDLIASFADQAGIAIENARLLNELRESLDRQIATSEVLSAISGSPGQLEPIFNTMIENATRLCRAEVGTLALYDSGAFRGAAVSGHASSYADTVSRLNAPTGTGLSLMEHTKETVQIDDVAAVSAYDEVRQLNPDFQRIRTALYVPIRKHSELIGAFMVYRHEVRAFDEKQVELVESFADQAVIAIENARLLAELRESLHQQTATADVLEIISRSAFDLQRVFETVAESSARLCEADKAFIHRYDGKLLPMVAAFNAAPDFKEWVAKNPVPPGRHSGSARAALERRTIHILDVRADPEYSYGAKDIEDIRTILGVPILKGDDLLGVIMIYRLEVRPFTDKQIALVETFADQAGIAIENARLLEELNARNRDLAESLEQQTAMSDILHAIASSPGDAMRVLDIIVHTAQRLFGAWSANIAQIGDNVFRDVMGVGPDAEAVVEGLKGRAVGPDTVSGRAVRERRLVQIEDVGESDLNLRIEGTFNPSRTIACAPLLREDEAIGTLAVVRAELRPFTDKEQALLQSFANQAVIAIENARLLRELRESLETQTASADILRTIAASPSDADAALDAIAVTTARLFGAVGATIRTVHADKLRLVGSAGPASQGIRAAVGDEIPITSDTLPGSVVRGKQPIHIPDVDNPDADIAHWPGLAPQRAAGVRTVVGTPLMRQGQAIGALMVQRGELKPFTEKEIAQLANFADQAVIAIENARLLQELRESLDRRTAIAEVLQVISSSPGDLQPVFETMLKSAVRLCDAWNGSVFQIEGDLFRRVTSVNLSPELAAQVELRYAADLPAARMLVSKSAVHIVDVMAELEERPDHPTLRMAAERMGARSALWVPMVKDNEVVAAFVLSRREARAFTEAQIGLVENFATQAVIAIDNARLLAELREARDAAERNLVELRAAQASLIQAEKMSSLGQLTAGIAHEIKNPLNFVNNFAGLSVELLDELKEAQAAAVAALDTDKRAEIDEIANMLTSNLAKIAEHGRRADGIVKSMLAHSRGGSDERQEVNLNSLVEDSLNLAYHGARAQDQNFNVTLERDLHPSMAPLELVPQELTRVFLNLFANGFYAAEKRRRDGGDPAFGPVLKVATRDLGGAVEIRIRDNGVGIPAEDKVRLFEPFFTTKPTGEGTGLGLSISYDIVTQQHRGSITVESEPGAFTEFTVTLPRRTAPAAGVDRSVAE